MYRVIIMQKNNMMRPFLLYDDLVELCNAVIAMGMGAKGNQLVNSNQ